ncbi:MAG: putative sodium/proton antiporter [Pseudonocardiales bacterium]|nr:putative sodium/proton antiporter [Pseudonocardiales bacterium]
MEHVLAFIIAAAAVVVVVELIAEKTGLPAAALLTISGLIYVVLPGPNVELEPEIVLTFILPPLLYSAALNSSLLAIRKNLRSVISLSVVLVLITALAVGWGMSLFVPGITLAAGIAMGAAVAPPDPVAALAIGRRAGLPPKLITLIEGEGLLNDATALTVFTVAVAAVTSGRSSLVDFGWRFVLAAVGGLAVGIIIALIVRLVRSVLKEPVLVNSLSLVTPFAAYLLGEELHVSGVLAVVIAGLIVGHDTPRFVSGASRLQTSAVWRLVDFLLEGFVFLLIGQQLPEVIDGLSDYSTATIMKATAVTLLVVLLLRPLWLEVTQSLPRRLHTRLGGEARTDESRLDGKEVLVLSWAGTRGVITLAAIFSLPLVTDAGAPFPGRDLLQFCAYLVVLVTLLGQGITFAPIVRAAGLRADAAGAARDRNEARVAAVEAALNRLDQIVHDDVVPEDSAEALRTSLNTRLTRYQRRLSVLESAEDGEIPVSASYEAALRTRRAIIDAQREEILRWRDAGRLSDESLRTLERELDFEERALPDRDDH